MIFMFGYMGSVLRVNLTKQRFFTENLRKDLVRKFVGGNGFGITVLLREVGRDTGSLASENKLIFATGSLIGTPIPVACMYWNNFFMVVIGRMFVSLLPPRPHDEKVALRVERAICMACIGATRDISI